MDYRKAVSITKYYDTKVKELVEEYNIKMAEAYNNFVPKCLDRAYVSPLFEVDDFSLTPPVRQWDDDWGYVYATKDIKGVDVTEVRRIIGES